jgi:hypothetical protein
MINVKADNFSALTIALEDGTAEIMGDGMLALLQRDERRKLNNVVLSRRDLEVLETSDRLILGLEDGEAHYMGDDVWTVLQQDVVAQAPQSLVVSREDLQALLAAA